LKVLSIFSPRKIDHHHHAMIKDELIMIREDGFTDQSNSATCNVPTFLVGVVAVLFFPTVKNI
jgi:hypothetical protein